MKVKEESEKVGLKLNIQKLRSRHPVPSLHGKQMGKSGNRHFIFLGSKITVDGGCSHEIKRHLLLGRKAMTNLDSVLQSRDITLLTKVHIVKAVVFLPIYSEIKYDCGCCSVTQSCLTLKPQGLQHIRLPCPSLYPGVCSNSCPLSR